MKMCRLLFILILFASGCSIKMVSYSPSLLMDGSGIVYVRDFKYLPYESGIQKSNQVDTGAGLNPIYAGMDIKDYVANALLKELKFIGYRIDSNSPIIISGDILEYSCDYVGFVNVDVKVRILFRVAKLQDGKWNTVYAKENNGFYRANKLTATEYTLILNTGLQNCIKSFIVEAQSEKVL